MIKLIPLEYNKGEKAGMGGLVTIKDSSWFMSWVVPKHPHFINQSDNVKVLWAYALNLNIKGDYVNKTLSKCIGREIKYIIDYNFKKEYNYYIL